MNITDFWSNNYIRNPNKICIHQLNKNGDHLDYNWEYLFNLKNNYKEKLNKNNIKKNMKLAILLPASIDFIALVWACLELNICFCPLPPNLPKQRIKEQIKFANFHALINLNCEIEILNLNLNLVNEDDSYLFFTSGSTGVPKGVVCSSKGLLNLAKEQIKWFGVNEESITTWMLSPSFDASLSDIVVPLTANAKLIIVPHKHWLRYKVFKQNVDDLKITHIDAPPSLLSMWEDLEIPKSLKCVIAGGEPTPPNLIKKWSKKIKWINVYGPTEATVCSSAEERNEINAINPTIGLPFENITYAILNNNNLHIDESNSVDENIGGELLIGGNCLANYYLNDEKLTNERFVIIDGKRWFKTHDWVRKINNNFIYCGRIDRQIKKNGQLINLDEIENIINLYPNIGNCVIIYKNNKIYAFILNEIKDDNLNNLKEYIKNKLPSWGIPYIKKINEWPLNIHNKIDKNKLEELI